MKKKFLVFFMADATWFAKADRRCTGRACAQQLDLSCLVGLSLRAGQWNAMCNDSAWMSGKRGPAALGLEKALGWYFR